MRHHIYIYALLITISSSLCAQQYATHSMLSQGSWYAVDIANEGMYQLTTSSLSALNGCRIDHIGLYTLASGMLNETNRANTPNDLQLLPFEINDVNNNGIFDANDRIVFYAEGSSVWRYNAVTRRYEYQRHAYATLNHIYVTTTEGGTIINTINVSEMPANTITTHTAVAIHDNDEVNAYQSGRIFVGEKLTAGVTSRTIDVPISGTSAGDLSCRIAFAGTECASSEFSVTLGTENKHYAMPYETDYYTQTVTFADNGAATQHFIINFTPSATQATAYLDFIEINAPRQLRYDNAQQTYRFPDLENNATALISSSNSFRIWDVSLPTHPVELELQHSGTIYKAALTAATATTLVAFNESSLLSPTSVYPIQNQDLHSLSGIEYVVVTHPSYLPQAQQLASLHAVEDGLTTAVVTDQQVYNEFSSGRQDPMAIRSLMRMLYNRAIANESAKPRFLLLFGKGTYDNRNLKNLGQTTVVTYESENSFNKTNSYGSDDLFGYLDDGERDATNGNLDIAIGRLPARTSAEADHFIDKLTRYRHRSDFERGDVRSDWRTYVTLLADDADPSSAGDSIFAHSAEVLARTIGRRYPNLNIDRIYADAFVQQSGSIGSYYPDVNNALKRRLDAGCLLTNYIGHGSMQYIGTERYITLADVDGYTNRDQLTFFVTSTCTYGKYDMPGETCGAEAMLLAQGGAIGVISASRPIFHDENFNTMLCSLALANGNSVGEALRVAKNSNDVSPAITLLGDPALCLSLPRYNATITAINNKEVDSLCADSASALSEVLVEGAITDDDGNTVSDFNGTLYATIYDRSTVAHTLANDNPNTEVAFTEQKNILHSGTSTVTNGQFAFSFRIPRDISFTYGQGRISLYANSATEDAMGNYCNIYFGGIDTTATFDTLRPTIQLFIADTNFRSGAIANDEPVLLAFLSDSVGINAVGTGLGHDITLTIDGRGSSTVVLNQLYTPSLSDPRNGTITYTLPPLDEGYHTLSLKAWNIYNYSSTATITFRVSKNDVEVSSFSASPNPARHKVQLRAEHNRPNGIANATISIYNHHGREVTRLKPPINPSSLVIGPVSWDFTQSNTPLANGIYIARITITTTSGEEISRNTRIIKIQ